MDYFKCPKINLKTKKYDKFITIANNAIQVQNNLISIEIKVLVTSSSAFLHMHAHTHTMIDALELSIVVS